MSNMEGIRKYPHLFMPIQLGNRLFRNRIFASPTGYQNLNGNGFLNDGAAAYYGRKAMGGAASVATFEGIVDGELGRGGDTHIALDNPHIGTELARIAYGISQYGAVATLELQHTGMFANRDLSVFGAASKGVAYGPVECKYGGRHILPMTEEILERTIRKYVDAALLAKRCGFGMVLVHAGHGWMLHQFLSPVTNTRTDRWGGASAENRCRLLITIIDEIHKACGPGFPVEVRISGSECYDGGFDIENGIAVAKQLDGHADLIHVSAGNHEVDEVFAVTHPSMFLKDGCNVYLAAEIKKHVHTPVATVGALSEPDLMEEIIASGRADVVEAGRQFLADPDFPNKIRSGHADEVRKCMRCLSCFSSELTNGEPYCAINPESGRELELRNAPSEAARKKKVLVAGGGVGGMQAALTCAQQGHTVILCEKSGRLGGVLRCEEKVDFKQKLGEYLDLQERTMFSRDDIEVRLNTEVTPELIAETAPDVVIAALGSAPVCPKLEGMEESEHVMSAQEAYKRTDELGEKVIILGAGLVGIELGLHLRGLGKTVTVLELTDHINDGGNFLHMPGLRSEIKKRGLPILFSTRALSLTKTGVLCENADGEFELPCDSFIYAVGQKPLQDEAAALLSAAPEVLLVGDCIAPRNITSATTEAYFAARNIGRDY